VLAFFPESSQLAIKILTSLCFDASRRPVRYVVAAAASASFSFRSKLYLEIASIFVGFFNCTQKCRSNYII